MLDAPARVDGMLSPTIRIVQDFSWSLGLLLISLHVLQRMFSGRFQSFKNRLQLEAVSAARKILASATIPRS